MCFGGFLGVRFAVQNVVSMLRNALKSVPGVNIQAGRIDISIIPPRLDVDSIYIAKKRSRTALLELTQLHIEPDYSVLLSGKLGASVSAKSHGGKIEGHVVTGSFDLTTIAAGLDIKKLSLARVPYLASMDKKTQGTATLHLEYDGSIQDVRKAEGRLVAAGSNLRIKNPVPIIKKECFEDMVVTTTVDFDGTSLKVDNFRLREKTMRSDVKGSMKLNMRNIIDSKVSMRSSLYIPPQELIVELLDPKAVKRLESGDAIDVSINGRLASPAIVMK